jgi:molybdate transport system substrate-binding protein
MRRLLAGLLVVVFAGSAAAEPLRIAVAANFQDTFAALVAAYEKQSSDSIEGTFDATGSLYKQIINGAPFAAFFAADGERTEQLVANGRAKATSRFVYAIGRLALWTPGAPSQTPSDWLADPQHRIAIANPDIAPYGLAAKQTLTSMKLWDPIQPRLVIGNSAAQAMQFVESKSTDGGFVAQAQLVAHYHGNPPATDVWLVPLNMHTPIVQEAVVLNTPAADRAQAFLTFVASDAGRALIEAGGYAVLAPVH